MVSHGGAECPVPVTLSTFVRALIARWRRVPQRPIRPLPTGHDPKMSCGLGTGIHILNNIAAVVTAMCTLDDVQHAYVGQVRSSLVR